MNNHYFIDIHVLQTVPPSCVNRDDMGSPKTAVYGGTTRARVSSQAWKRAVRVMFKDMFDRELLGDRTKRVAEMIAAELKKLNPELDGMKKAIEATKLAGLSVSKKKEEQVDALMFVSTAQAKALAQLIYEDCADKEAYKKALRENPSIDMALFGRMVAADASLNYDAAVQVAHSISTHTVHNDFDYFTAVDDRSPEDTAGAGHLGTIEFNSSTLYRYATINLGELYGHLGELTPQTVRGFIDAFVRSMPTGKLNTFANRTFPDCVYITMRRDQPVNLCGAFEDSVKSSDNGFVAESVTALSSYAQSIYENYAAQPERSWCLGKGLDSLGEASPLPQLLTSIEQTVKETLGESEVG